MRATGRLAALAALGLASAVASLFVPAWRSLWWLPLAAAGLLLLLDMIAAAGRPRLKVERAVPDSLILDRPAAIELRVEAPWPKARVRVYDGVPASFASEGLPLSLDLRSAPTGSGAVSIAYRVRPGCRGLGEWERGWADVEGPLGLVARRERIAEGGVSRVYPDSSAYASGGFALHGEKGGDSRSARTRRRGHGTEFEQLREYRRGDPPRLIDGAASSRMRRPIVREMKDEEDQTVVFLLDTGYRMTASEGGKSHFDRAFESMLSLARVALRQGDRVGALAWGPVERWVPPRRGMAAYPAMVNALYDIQAQCAASSPVIALQDALPRLRRRSLLILLTNFREEDGDGMELPLAVAGERHLVLTVWMREVEIDRIAGRAPADADEAVETAVALDYLRKRDECRLRWESRGALTLDTAPEGLTPNLIARYWDIKKRAGL